jgi:hypothetical protein
MTIVEHNFKFTFTSETIRYSFNNLITIEEFIYFIIENIRNEFRIRPDLIIEIVEAGLNTEECSSEMAHALQPSCISFKNYYINRNTDNLSFYIRVKTLNNSLLVNLSQMQQEDV